MTFFYQRSFVSDLNLIWMIKEQLLHFSHVATCHYRQPRTKDVRHQVADGILFLTPFLRLLFVWHYETCCATNASVTGNKFVVAVSEIPPDETRSARFESGASGSPDKHPALKDCVPTQRPLRIRLHPVVRDDVESGGNRPAVITVGQKPLTEFFSLIFSDHA